jgi:hypothetical protein
MSEKLENCEECSGILFRIPSTTFTTKKIGGNEKPGQIVKEFIEDVKEEVEAEKEKMKLGLDE